MGRYFDDKISLVDLDDANPSFLSLQAAAAAVEQAEIDWYKRRKDVFNELDFGDFNKTEEQIEDDYATLVSGLSVYEFKDKFDDLEVDRKTDTQEFRLVHNTFPTSNITDGYSTEIFVEEEDEDGDTGFVVADNVLSYHIGRGKGAVDTLYDDLAAFSTSSRSDAEFYEFIDGDDPGYFVVDNVFKGFGEVPLAWEAVPGYTDQQLQVMNAAGNDYDSEVGPAIAEYEAALASYIDGGGGNLEDSSVVYKGVAAGEFVIGVAYQIKEPGTTVFTDIGAANNLAGTRFIATGVGSGDGTATADMFPYENYVGVTRSYNRPQTLPLELIKETRGLGS